jgi:hypothetical protein
MKRTFAAALIVTPAILAAGVASAGLMAITPVAPVPQLEPVSGLVDGTLADTGLPIDLPALPIDLPALPEVTEVVDLGTVTAPVTALVQEVLPQATPILPPGILQTVTDPVAAVAAAPVSALAPVAGVLEQVTGTSAIATVEAVVDSLGLPVDVPALPALDPASLLNTVSSTVAGLGLPISLPGLG